MLDAVVFVLQMLVTIALGVTLYGAKGPENWLGLIPAVLLGVACFAGLGFGAAALIRSAEGASAVVNLIVLPMAFLSGSFGPTRKLPRGAAVDRRPPAADLPDRPDARTSTCAATRSSGTRRRSRSWPPGVSPASCVAWRRFGWEPREQ